MSADQIIEMIEEGAKYWPTFGNQQEIHATVTLANGAVCPLIPGDMHEVLHGLFIQEDELVQSTTAATNLEFVWAEHANPTEEGLQAAVESYNASLNTMMFSYNDTSVDDSMRIIDYAFYSPDDEEESDGSTDGGLEGRLYSGDRSIQLNFQHQYQKLMLEYFKVAGDQVVDDQSRSFTSIEHVVILMNGSICAIDVNTQISPMRPVYMGDDGYLHISQYNSKYSFINTGDRSTVDSRIMHDNLMNQTDPDYVIREWITRSSL